MAPYVPLWTKSNFSFLEGASHPAELVERAHALGLPALALTDRDGVYGIVRAFVRARELGLKMIYGAQVSVGPTTAQAEPLILLACDRQGYGRMTRLLSVGRMRSDKGACLVHLDEVQTLFDAPPHGTPGLIAVCPHPALLQPLADPFGGRLYAMVTRHRAAADPTHEAHLRRSARHVGVPVVGGIEVLYHTASRRPLQDVLSCIRYGTTLSKAGQRIRGNAEHDLKPPHAMAELFADDPAALAGTLEVAERCTFNLDQIRYRYPGERIPTGMSEGQWLRQLTEQGATERYGGFVPSDVQVQLDRELALIDELQYGGYFLTMWEIVQFCRREHILCQGRGSAANSAVCYCLGVTAIDPVRMDLLFERFLSRERAEPPDIDLDIEHQRREEVIQWVYARYGRRHAAMVCNVIRYRARSAVRDVGKALGIPQTALDRVAKLLGHYDSGVGGELLLHAGLDPKAPTHDHLLRLVAEIADFPRHISIHPGGFLLGDVPVDTLVPIEPATMEDRTVVQWDKYDVEDLGLFKVDLLGLGALTMIRSCFELLAEHEAEQLTMATVPSEDPVTYAMISRGDTVGTFQIESRAQMAMLPRLQPRTFYDLVIEVAIVRPGPIQGDMVHPYLRRRSGKERVSFPHKSLERVLAKTLGVPIFQEQVMKLAVLVADYTPGEADGLRRDMAAWRSSGRIEQHRERIVGRMVANGIGEEFAERVFSQIRGFGEYGFPESHAASFALIAYVTCWLRCHHPAAFTCALLNAQPMGFYSPATLVEDAKHHGVAVLPVDAQRSSWNCTLESRPSNDRGHAVPRKRLAIRMGLRYVRTFGEREKTKLELAPGPYASVDDFVRRTRLGSGPLQVLAEAGGLASFGLSRRDAIWTVRGLLAKSHDSLALPGNVSAPEQQPLFSTLSAGESILWDYRTSMHSTRGHPLLCVRAELNRRGYPLAEGIGSMRDGQHTDFVGMVICRQRPGTASGVTFFTLEDETGFVNLVVWQKTFAEHRILAKTALVLGVSGRIQQADGVTHLIADSLWDPDLKLAPEGTTSRDFH